MRTRNIINPYTCTWLTTLYIVTWFHSCNGSYCKFGTWWFLKSMSSSMVKCKNHNCCFLISFSNVQVLWIFLCRLQCQRYNCCIFQDCACLRLQLFCLWCNFEALQHTWDSLISKTKQIWNFKQMTAWIWCNLHNLGWLKHQYFDWFYYYSCCYVVGVWNLNVLVFNIRFIRWLFAKESRIHGRMQLTHSNRMIF